MQGLQSACNTLNECVCVCVNILVHEYYIDTYDRIYFTVRQVSALI